MARKKKPTTIALISDIHGNLPALEAVLDDAARCGVDEIWNLGDMVGYAPFPNEVIQRLQDVKAVNIIGNYDLKVLAFARNQEKWKRKKPPAKYIAFQWNHASLRGEARAFLKSLPEQARRAVGGRTVLLVHGSPASVEELIGSSTPRSRLRELADIAGADTVVCGHSHEPFTRNVGPAWFVNPGSVGRPEGGDGRACYALLEFAGDELKVAQRRVTYDIDRVARAVHAAGLPEDFINVFRKARNLDRLWEEAAELDRGAKKPPRPEDKTLNAVMALAQRCRYERDHTHQVTKLALELFDGLKGLHRMGAQERLWLQCGALLHDIGWGRGQQGHHKAAMRLIVADAGLPFERREREIVALIARYHRKALPSDRHKYFANLDEAGQHSVAVLAGILRVADGLDRSHASVVRSVRCAVSKREIAIVCEVEGTADAEVTAAGKKGDLLETVFNRRLVMKLSVP